MCFARQDLQCSCLLWIINNSQLNQQHEHMQLVPQARFGDKRWKASVGK